MNEVILILLQIPFSYSTLLCLFNVFDNEEGYFFCEGCTVTFSDPISDEDKNVLESFLSLSVNPCKSRSHSFLSSQSQHYFRMDL